MAVMEPAPTAESIARSIRIPADIDRIVKRLALEEDRSVSSQYIHLIRAGLHARKAPEQTSDASAF